MNGNLVKYLLIGAVVIVGYHLLVTKTSLGAKVGVSASA